MPTHGERARDDDRDVSRHGRERWLHEDVPPGDDPAHGGRALGDGHHRAGPAGGARKRRQGRRLLRVLAPYDVLGARQRVRARVPRGLLGASAAARPDRALLRARRLGPANRERVRGGHGRIQRPLPLHVDADGARRRVDPRPGRRALSRTLAAGALPRARPRARAPRARPRRGRLTQPPAPRQRHPCRSAR